MQLVKPDAPILRKVCQADFEISVEKEGLGLAARHRRPTVVIEWSEVFINRIVIHCN